MIRSVNLFAAALLALSALAVPPSAVRAAEADHPEAEPFDEDADASLAVAVAYARAVFYRKRVLIVMGANWCHDSRGLAGLFATPRFAAMLASRYELVYVDAGQPRAGLPRNLDIARSLGIERLDGTPNVFVASADGRLLNPETATRWNDAASRDEDEVFAYFVEFEDERRPASR